MTLAECLASIASVATAVGVGVAAYQLFVARQQARTTFEDLLNGQYWVLIKRLPLEALSGEHIGQETMIDYLLTSTGTLIAAMNKPFSSRTAGSQRRRGRTGKTAFSRSWRGLHLLSHGRRWQHAQASTLTTYATCAAKPQHRLRQRLARTSCRLM
ncbi:MAG: hypothetical protein RET84_02555 [Pseudomonadota bacterium]|nr:hypothetical protein [Pseudomonadota bacterium]